MDMKLFSSIILGHISVKKSSLLKFCETMYKQYKLSYLFCHQINNHIGGVMVSMLASSVVDRGFIDGVMVSMLASNVVDRGFISGVMISILASNVVDRGFFGGVMISVLSPRVW
jgi:hypothetical protein